MRSCSRPRPTRATLTLLALALLLPLVAQARWIDLGGDQPVTVELISDAPGRTVYAIEIGGFEATPVDIGGQTYYDIWLPGESRALEAGLPELPDVRRALAIPDDRTMRVTVLEAEHVDLPDLPVAPSKGNLLRSVDPAMVPYTFDPFYSGGDAWPAEVLTADDPHIVRDLRGMVVDANVFQYIPARETLRVHTRLVVEVADNGPGEVNVLARSRAFGRVDPQFDGLYRDHFINYDAGRDTTVLEQGSLLVIADDAFAAQMQPLVEWKRQKGIDARLVTLGETGTTFSQIKAYIASAYSAWGPAYVLLVGDIAQIPIGSDSDPEYSLLAGSDSYPEVFVGRFSAENADHVNTQVLRTITYERDQTAGDAWAQYGMGVASTEGPGDDGEYDDEHEDVIRQKLLAYGYLGVDQIYDPYGTAAQVTGSLNAGRGIINYTGHGSQTSWGSSGFNSNHVNALANQDMLPFICSVACNNGTFTGTCFAEAWLRATDGGVPTGAVATYMSYISQSWNPPMCGQDAAIDLLVRDEMRTIGGLWFNGSCQMMDEYGASGANEFLNWTIFGDPSLMVRTRAATELTISHPGVLLIGMTDYVVQAGERGAFCALYADGVIYGTATADAAGQAVITLDQVPAEPMTLTLTVTGYNKTTVQESVAVLPPEGPYLVFEGAMIDDASGDQDGLLDAGEAVGLTVTLENVGVESATGVNVHLVCDDPRVDVTSAVADFPDIPAGGTAEGLSAFAVELAPEFMDGDVLSFTLEITGDGGAWEGGFNVPVQAPMLRLEACLVDDSAGGDGSGDADAGESVRLEVRLANQGTSDATALVGTLVSHDTLVTVLDGAGDCAGIAAGSVGLVGTFEVAIDAACPEPALLALELAVTLADGAPVIALFDLAVGGWFDDMEADRGWTVGAPGDDASSGLWARLDPVGTEYDGTTVQPEDDHTPAPGTMCWVTGNGSVGGAAGEDDVDGGKTTLLSPVFQLAGATMATVSYWRWYTNDLGNSPGEDWWEVSVTDDGATWVQLEYTQASASSWQQFSFDLAEYVELTDQVQLRFVASDAGSGSLVEAAVDDFLLDTFFDVTTSAPARAELPAALVLEGNHPNPFNPSTTIRFAVPRDMEIQLVVFDLAGRRVATLVDGQMAAGLHEVSWLGRDERGGQVASGIYFCRLADGQSVHTRKMMLVK